MTIENAAGGNQMRVRVVDAFTDRPLAGNPAGVVLIETEDWPDASLMQGIAGEVGHETAFARRLPPGGAADWALRWFTPGSESNVCGHGTLATLHAMRSDVGGPLSVRFATQYGLLVARAEAEGPITLDFPAAVLMEAAIPVGLPEALGIELDGAVSTGELGDLLVTTQDESTVRDARPNISALGEVIERHGIRGVIITAAAANPDEGFDFVSRFFSPATGVPEDPVTGSAHTALAPYWAGRLGRSRLVGLQVSDRSGLVATSVRADRVELTGNAVVVLDGFLTLG